MSLIEIDMDNEAEGVESDIEAEPLLEEADRIVASSAPEFHECLPATDKDWRLCVRLCSGAENGPVGRGLQDDAEIDSTQQLESLDEAFAAFALVPDRAAAKKVSAGSAVFPHFPSIRTQPA